VQGAVSVALEAGGWYRPEKRPFWPHVTLARVKRGERRVSPLPGDPAPPGAPFEARELTLYRSTLRPQGALYEPLARATL
jgi:2'-5' RNA ligase